MSAAYVLQSRSSFCLVGVDEIIGSLPSKCFQWGYLALVGR